MTDEERWKIEGRTRDAMEASKRKVATLKADIETHAQKLKEAADQLTSFLAEPIGKGPTGMLRDEYIVHFFKTVLPDDFDMKLREFASETAALRKLEDQVKGMRPT